MANEETRALTIMEAVDAVLDNEWFASGGTVTNAYIVAEHDWTALREARAALRDVAEQIRSERAGEYGTGTDD